MYSFPDVVEPSGRGQMRRNPQICGCHKYHQCGHRRDDICIAFASRMAIADGHDEEDRAYSCLRFGLSVRQ